MKYINLLPIVLLLFSSCSKDESNSKNNVLPPNKSQQAIVENKSTIKAEIIEIEKKDGGSYILTVKALNVDDDSGYQNIAVSGEIYKLTPNFSLDPLGNKFNNEKNKRLGELLKQNAGDTLFLEISLSQKDGWIINKVLEKE
jgi:hypothetical protein